MHIPHHATLFFFRQTIHVEQESLEFDRADITMAGLTVLRPKRKNKTVYSNQKELFVIHFRIVTYEDEKKKTTRPPNWVRNSGNQILPQTARHQPDLIEY